MKYIHLIFFFVSLIPTIFNSSEDDYYISVQSGINTPQCIVDAYGRRKIQFSFYAITSGLANTDLIVIQLAYPDYAIAECYPTLSVQEGANDVITCSIDVANFPLLSDPYAYSLPTNLGSALIINKGYEVYVEKWYDFIGVNPNIINTGCYVEAKCTFTKNNDPVYVEVDDYGTRHVYAKGSFDYPVSYSNQNYLTSSDSICEFRSYIFVDTYFDYYDCQIYDPDETLNSGDFTLHCAIPGEKKATFFPTLSYSELEQGYVLVNIYGEVSLSGTFAKLSGLLLLSLLLF